MHSISSLFKCYDNYDVYDRSSLYSPGSTTESPCASPAYSLRSRGSSLSLDSDKGSDGYWSIDEFHKDVPTMKPAFKDFSVGDTMGGATTFGCHDKFPHSCGGVHLHGLYRIAGKSSLGFFFSGYKTEHLKPLFLEFFGDGVDKNFNTLKAAGLFPHLSMGDTLGQILAEALNAVFGPIDLGFTTGYMRIRPTGTAVLVTESIAVIGTFGDARTILTDMNGKRFKFVSKAVHGGTQVVCYDLKKEPGFAVLGSPTFWDKFLWRDMVVKSDTLIEHALDEFKVADSSALSCALRLVNKGVQLSQPNVHNYVQGFGATVVKFGN